jgi:hypothetical protein
MQEKTSMLTMLLLFAGYIVLPENIRIHEVRNRKFVCGAL